MSTTRQTTLDEAGDQCKKRSCPLCGEDGIAVVSFPDHLTTCDAAQEGDDGR